MPSNREPGKPDQQGIGEGMQAYCVKCRTKRRMLDRRLEVSRAGREVAKGTCPVCGTTMCRLLGRTPKRKACDIGDTAAVPPVSS